MSDPNPSGKGFRLRGRWVLVILALSLILNIFFVASLIGHEWRKHHHCGRGDGVREFLHRNEDVKGIAGKLRRELRLEQRGLVEDLRSKLRLAQSEYIEALRAEPFDAESFAAKQAAYLDARAALRNLRREWMVRLVDKLTPEQRRRLATHFAERAKCRAEFWKRKEKRFEKGPDR